MKLAELEPRWWAFDNTGPRVGLTFICPCCKGTPRETRLGVVFHHKGREVIEDAYIHAHEDAKFIWTEDGEIVDQVTITPSIDASKNGHWHGFITAGHIS